MKKKKKGKGKVKVKGNGKKSEPIDESTWKY